MTYKNTNKRDINEAEIVAFWRDIGGVWIQQKLDAGFDGLLVYDCNSYIIEIKQPSSRDRLTPAEKDVRDLLVRHDVKYHVITTLEEAAELVGFELI